MESQETQVVNQKLTLSYLVALTVACRTAEVKYGTNQRLEDAIYALEYLPSYLSTDGTEICLQIIEEIESLLKEYISAQHEDPKLGELTAESLVS